MAIKLQKCNWVIKKCVLLQYEVVGYIEKETIELNN